MLCILPFDIVRSTNEWFLETIKWRGLSWSWCVQDVFSSISFP